MLKIKNVVKSNEKVQLYDIANASVNTGRYVKIGTPTHAQYNNEVSMSKSQYIFDTTDNIAFFTPIDETIDFTRFETIGDEPIFGYCITTQDIMDFYANGCIQGFYEEYCKLHTDKENLILAKVLSILGIEVYKDVTCFGGIYKGKYMVSNLANVLSLTKKHFGNIVKPCDNGRGYLIVQLCHNGKPKVVTVHRLMALTFYGEPIEKMDACHSNANSHDNRLVNVDFRTHHENINNPITQKKHKETRKAKADKASTASTSAESTLE